MSALLPPADRAGDLDGRWPSAAALGATPLEGSRTRFVVWAPSSPEVQVVVDPGGPTADRRVTLSRLGDGYHQGVVEACPPGTRYRYALSDGTEVADPASQWQPEGVHGPSAVVDVRAHRWQDDGFVAPPLGRYVLYELHVGTFTDEGTFDAAIGRLGALADLGITAVELMPVAQFPGRWNWGYDGVFPFAVQNSYGGPTGLQRLVDACHSHGLALVLDVVYNHVGPEGNVLDAFGPYLTDRYRTPWGKAVNVDGPGSDQVRRYFIENALGWFRHFHVDALRLDAVHSIVDATARPFLADLSSAVDELGQQLGRHLHLIAESADNDPRLTTPRSTGGLGIHGQWNDDFHHALHAVVTGERSGYYRDFGSPDQLARTVAEGFFFQGEYSVTRERRHGAPSAGIRPDQLVVFAQNHDHIGNRAAGDRLAATLDDSALRLVAAVLLLAPGIPLLFMGEEYGEVAPFPYFVDHGDPELLAAVRQGRAREAAALGDTAGGPDPTDPATRDSAVLAWDRRSADGHRQLLAHYARLLRFRSLHPVLSRLDRARRTAYATGEVLVAVWWSAQCTTALVFNLADRPAAVPLPAGPPDPGHWAMTLGDTGAVVPEGDGSGRWQLDPWQFAVFDWTDGTHDPPDGAPQGSEDEREEQRP